MPRPIVQQLPPAPQRGEDFQTFTEKANAHVAALTPWTDDVNSLGAWVESAAADVDQDRQDAQTARQGAEDAESAAAISENKAEEWAEKAEDSEVEPGQFSAKHWAAKAEEWAEKAEDSEVEPGQFSAKHWAAKAEESVSALPEGAINDTLVDTDKTWSSQKISSDLGQKQDTLPDGNQDDVLTWDNGEYKPLPMTPGMISKYEEFTASGIWHKDPNAMWVYVEAIGGGGGGANHTSTTGIQAGGGGEFLSRLFRSHELPSSLSVAVGAGGLGGASGSNTPGSDGGSSEFGGVIAALGGIGGTVSGDRGGFPRTGGLVSASVAGTLKYSSSPVAGVGSVTGSGSGGNTIYGGAGGGGGLGGAGGVSAFGGNGGAGNSDGGVKAEDGSFPSGGGGASNNNGGGGDGADGVVRIWQW